MYQVCTKNNQPTPPKKPETKYKQPKKPPPNKQTNLPHKQTHTLPNPT